MKTILPYLFIVAICLSKPTFAQIPSLTAKEKKQGWKLLFDGKTSNGWSGMDGKPFPDKGWKIENGYLHFDPKEGRTGSLITKEEFADFVLVLEFKITKGANSGIKYYLLPGTGVGCEYQVLDDDVHPDAKLGKDGNRTQAGLYDLIPPSPAKKNKPIGEWNQARIVARKGRVEHWLNGVKTVEFDRFSPEFQQLVQGSKFKEIAGFAQVKQSSLLLQDHGDEVFYRNIKIRKL
jgi:hypothetical protein